MTSHRVRLPAGIRPPFQIYVNGVPKRPGDDFEIRAGEIVFHEPLVQEGKLGGKAWFMGFWGVGTYKKNDEIDVRYEEHGRPKVAQGLPLVDETAA